MLKAFYHSLFNTDWLAAQRNRLGFAWLYVTVFLGVLAVFVTAVNMRTVAPILREIKTEVVKQVPDFTAELKAGVLTIDGPQQFAFQDSDLNVVVDVRPTSTAAIADYRNSSVATVLLTSTTLSVYDYNSGKTNILPLATYGELKGSKADLIKGADWLGVNGPKIFTVLFFFIFWLGGLIGKTVYAGVVALILWSMMTNRHDPQHSAWSWRQVWTVSLFALTLPTLIQQIERWFGFYIPGLYTLVLGGLVYLVLRTPVAPVEPEKTPTPAPADTPV